MPNTPPLPSTFASSASRVSATSSPKTRTRSSAAITSWSVRLMASPNVTGSPASSEASPATSDSSSTRSGSTTTWSATERGSGRGAASASRAASATSAFASSQHASTSSSVSTPRARSAAPIVSSGSRAASSASSSGGPVLALGVGGGVRVRPGDARVDEGGPDAGPHARHHLRRERPHGVVVAAVDRVHLEAAEPAHHLVAPAPGAWSAAGTEIA